MKSLKTWFRKFLALILGAVLSALLICSIPFLQYILQQKKAEEVLQKTPITLKKMDLQKDKQDNKPRTTPKKISSNQRNVKSGPKFGVDLGVMGAGGVALPTDLVAKSGGGVGNSMGAETGDVDARPELEGALSWDLPRNIRENQINSSLALKFCVDVRGKAYNIQILEERPSGQGLGDAGRKAIEKASFQAAQKGGNPVAFCGVEQEFQVNFND